MNHPAQNVPDTGADSSVTQTPQTLRTAMWRVTRQAHEAVSRHAENVILTLGAAGIAATLAGADPAKAQDTSQGSDARRIQVADTGNATMTDAIVPGFDTNLTHDSNGRIVVAELKPNDWRTQIASITPEKDSVAYRFLREKGLDPKIVTKERDRETVATPIRTQRDLGLLVPGGENIPHRGLEEILNLAPEMRGVLEGVHQIVTGYTITQLFDEATNYKEHPGDLLSFRTYTTDGGKTYKPVFRPNSTEPMPGAEDEAARILADLDALRENVVKPMVEGKVPYDTLEKWAENFAVIMGLVPEDVINRWVVCRLGPGFLVGVESHKRDYAKLLTKDPTGETYFAPPSQISNRAIIASSSFVEAMRLMGMTDPSVKTYYANATIAGVTREVRIGDIGNGETRQTIQSLTGLSSQFLDQMRKYANSSGTLVAIADQVRTNPAIRQAIAKETPQSVMQWAPGISGKLDGNGARIIALWKAAQAAKTNAEKIQYIKAANDLSKIGPGDEIFMAEYAAATSEMLGKNAFWWDDPLSPIMATPLIMYSKVSADSLREKVEGKSTGS